MKKLLSYSCLIFIVFSFMSTVLAQENQSSSKSTNRFSLNIELDYLTAQYQKLKPSDEEYMFDNSEKLAGYLGLTVSWTFNLPINLSIKHGIIVLFNHDYKNKFETEHYNESTYETYTIENKQKYNQGLGILLNLGYRIRFSSIELLPYIGVSFLRNTSTVHQTTDKYDDNTISEVRTIYDKIPIYAGLNIVFLTSELFNLFTGFELGYAISQDYESLAAYGWGYNKEPAKRISKNSDPLSGFMGKIILGVSFNFL